MTNTTKTENYILEYLKGRDWTSPTQIGQSYAIGYHSSWASPKCKSLVKKGYLKRNEKGHYKLV